MLKRDVPRTIEKEDGAITAFAYGISCMSFPRRYSQGEGVSKEATSIALAHKFKLNRPAAATTILVQQLTADGYGARHQEACQPQYRIRIHWRTTNLPSCSLHQMRAMFCRMPFCIGSRWPRSHRVCHEDPYRAALHSHYTSRAQYWSQCQREALLHRPGQQKWKMRLKALTRKRTGSVQMATSLQQHHALRGTYRLQR